MILTLPSQNKINKLPTKKLIELVFAKHRVSNQIYLANKAKKEWLSELENLIKYKSIPNLQETLYTIINKDKNLISSTKHINIIKNIIYYKSYQIQPIETWQPPKQNQIQSLINHLFCKYPIPTTLYKFFEYETYQAVEGIELALWITQGNPLKKYPLLPNIQKIKNSIHHIYQAPEHYNLNQIYKYCQLKTTNASDKLIDILLSHHTFHSIPKIYNRIQQAQKELFWLDCAQYFSKLHMLDYSIIPNLLDYINHQKFTNQQQLINNKITHQPNQPNFNIHNRNINTLIQQSEQWHQTIQKINTSKIHNWPNTIPTHTIKKSTNNHYTFKELTNTKELIDEGKTLHHCVASYSKSCAKGYCQIISMSQHDELNILNKKLITIELNKNIINQIKGNQNRKPQPHELQIILKWANILNLKLANHLK